MHGACPQTEKRPVAALSQAAVSDVTSSDVTSSTGMCDAPDDRMFREPLFANRADAGRVLAEHLARDARTPGVTILALPRGGVPVAFEVAIALGAPLDVFVVRKIGFPGHAELAMGAVASGGIAVLNEELVSALRIPIDLVEAAADREAAEVARQERIYREGRAPLPLHERTLILVDDGLATGTTMRAAVVALRRHAPERIVVAVPVGAPESCAELRREADELVCVHTPQQFFAVGLWYEDFRQTTDDEVRSLLARAPGSPLTPDWSGTRSV
jgi:putative phosphoribosyl transferase